MLCKEAVLGMGEGSCCRFVGFLRTNAFQAEESDASRSSRKPLKEANWGSFGNPRKGKRVDFIWTDRNGNGASMLMASPPNRLVSPAFMLKCDDRSTLIELRDIEGFHKDEKICDLQDHELVASIAKQQDAAAPTPLFAIAHIPCHIKNPTDASTSSCAAPVNTSAVHVINATHDVAIRVRTSDAHVNNDVHDGPARPTMQRRLRRGPKSLKVSPSSSKERLLGLISTLESVDTPADVLSSDLQLNASDFNIILHALKPSTKIAGLFCWMKDNCKTSGSLTVHAMVFKVLGKRQEWSVIDSLLREEVSHTQGKTSCEVFNTLFHVCIILGSPDWATKWFHFMLKEGIQPNVTTFSLLMRLYKRYEKLEEAAFVYQNMSSIGVECLKASSVMMKLYTHAHQFEKVKQIFNRMWEANPDPEMELCTLQLDAYVKEGKVQEAEEMMKHMLESGAIIDVAAYNSMITVNGKVGDFNSARDWFQRVEKDGLQPNTATYRSVIGACGRAGKLQEALGYYDRMILCQFSPSLINFNTLIHLHRKVENDGRILALLSDMREACCCPDSSTLDSVLKVYERYGRLENIPEALKLLREAGWSPSAKCYGILIRTYIRCNLVEQALEAFNNLCSTAKLEEIMCLNLICMCKSAGCYDEAIHVFHEMQRSGGIHPSLRTTCTIIDIYSLKGVVEEGEALFQGLRSSGQELDTVAYNVVLIMYLRGGLLEKAAEVLKLIKEHEGLQPDLYLFLCMLKVCAKCGMQEEAVDIYWRLVMSKLTWTESTYTGVIHCCGRALPLTEITKVFDAMVYANMPVNNVTCNVLIDIFGKAGLLEKAHYVLRLAQKQGVQDCISFSTIIDAYGKNKEFSEMETAFTEMLNEGFKGCVEAYNSMLDAYGKSGQIGKMETTFERMGTAGCNPNLSTFNTLIKVYGQEGLMEDLQGVLQKIEEADVKLDSYTYNTLIYAYGNAKMPDEAMKSFNEMQDAGFVPDLITYNCLISALEKGGHNQEAARLSSWIAEAGIEINP